MVRVQSLGYEETERDFNNAVSQEGGPEGMEKQVGCTGAPSTVVGVAEKAKIALISRP